MSNESTPLLSSGKRLSPLTTSFFALLVTLTIIASVGVVLISRHEHSSTLLQKHHYVAKRDSETGGFKLEMIPDNPNLAKPASDRFVYEHNFGGFGSGGLDRQVIVPPVDLSIGKPLTSSAVDTTSIASSLQQRGIFCPDWTPAQLSAFSAVLDEVFFTGASLPKGLHLTIYIVPTPFPDGDFMVAQRDAKGMPVRAAICAAAFDHATPAEATLNGQKGTIVSFRLKFAAVALLTDFGNNADNCEKMSEFWFHTKFADSVHPNYTAMTQTTTAEGPGRFTEFLPHEKLHLIQWWLMMAPSMYKLPGLDWSFRRGLGLEHPYYMYVPAVSWPDNQESSYTEFLDITFSRDLDTMRHLIIHEKTHFFYGKVMTHEQKLFWYGLGGWTKDWNQAWAALGTTTEFVSGYAGSVDPNEDLAESAAEYILHPQLLKTRATPKYIWIKNNLMDNVEYVPTFWPQVQFEVKNTVLASQMFPNPVKSVKIEVFGSEFEDKTVKVTLTLAPDHGYQAPITAAASISPPSGLAEAAVSLNFVQTGNTLVAEGIVKKTEEYGFWKSSQLELNDAFGLTRWVHLDESNWAVFINNKYFSEYALVYQPGSLKVVVDSSTSVPRVNVTFQYSGYHPPYHYYPVSARLVRKGATESYHVQGWGWCTGGWSSLSNLATCDVSLALNDYVKGQWYVAQVFMQEDTGRSFIEYYSTYLYDEIPTLFEVPGLGTDNIPPQVNVATYKMQAGPVNPAAPDGETVVEFSFDTKDEESGLAKATYRLLDPEGVSHLGNFPTPSATVARSEWQTLKLVLTLPKGSKAGVWGVEEVEVWDKAGNRADVRSIDTLIFKPSSVSPPVV